MFLQEENNPLKKAFSELDKCCEKEEKKENQEKQKYITPGTSKKIEREYNSILHEEKKRTAQSKMRKQRIDDLRLMEGSSINNTIKEEMDNSSRKKSWKCMDMCFKWKYVQEYIKDKDISSSDYEKIKKAVQQNTLDIDYDKASQTIKKLHFQTENGNNI